MKIQKTGQVQTTYLETAKWQDFEVPSIRYHIFEHLDFVKDGFSTRLGGVSTGQYESMNFSVKMGDTPENVRKNFEIFTKAHGFLNPVMTDQTHTTNVKRVYAKDAGKNVFLPRDYESVDGFVTDEPNLTLVTTFADCVPLYFVDEEHRAIGLAHSGWKGTIGRIGKKTVECMAEEFGTRPENLRAAIGPSICVRCYEVSKELAKDFANEFSDEVIQEKEGSCYLDLWAANYRVLVDSGILPENIAVPDICTCCNSEILFSHRASRGKRGNLCAFLSLNQ